MTDLYEALGVDPTADPAAIKAAYRRKAKAAHPDAGGDPEKFGAIAKAYEVLQDDAKRARYDATGETDFVDRSRDAAIALLDGYLEAVLQGGNVHADLVGEMRRRVQHEQAEIRKALGEGAAVTEHLEDMRKRFKSKGGLVERLIGERLKRIAAMKLRAEADLAARDQVLVLLADVEYRPKPVTIQMNLSTSTTSASSTWR